MVRALTENEVEFTIDCEPEDIPIEGNASAIDAETDAATERWIHEELERGNQWAWCCVVVKAHWNGFEGHDTLGGCSYESEAAFCEPGGYFDDMRIQALAELNDRLAHISEKLDRLRQ